MGEERIDADVAVVGAGTAGSAAAWALAKAGFRTVVLEGRDLDGAGARWANAVPPWFFDEAGIARPTPPEEQMEERSAVLLSRSGSRRAVMAGGMPYVGVDCRRLVRRLQGMGQDAGVQFLDRVRGAALEFDASGRPLALAARRLRGQDAETPLRVTARLFVDASGFGGTLRHQSPVLSADCPDPTPDETCSGANQIREVVDPEGARAYLASLGLAPGDTVNWAGVRGGFSTLVIHVRADVRTVLLTTGVTQEADRGTGLDILEQFVAESPWIGRAIFGGTGLIPIRRPYDRLGAPGIALVGDAACQVFPAHASGIGMGLMGARCLVDAVKGRPDPGAEDAVWAYQARFQRTHGPILGGFDAFRRLTVSLSAADVGALVGEGFVTGGSLRLALSQRLVPPNLAVEVPSIAQATIRRPDLAAKLAKAGTRMAAVAAMYRLHPEKPDREALRRWSRAVGTALGGRPDIA